MFRGTTIFRQTLLVLIGWLALMQVVIATGISLTQVSRSGHRTIPITDVVHQLAVPACSTNIARGSDRGKLFKAEAQTDAPIRPPGTESDPELTAEIANVVAASPSDIRLYWRAGSDIRLGQPADISLNGRTTRLEDTVFLDSLVAARRWSTHWCVSAVRGQPWYVSWQWNPILINFLALLTMIPPALLFARRLSRPIRDFAVAADRIGKDTTAPLVPESGPREMRVAAHALNAMQVRIQGQMRERESMVAAIAHDLRTPLSRIAFRVERATDDLREPVQRDIAQMRAMIAATIEHHQSSRTERAFALVDLRDLLLRMVEQEKTMGSDIRASLQNAEINGDLIALNRLFQNLIDNAKKFAGATEISLMSEADNAQIIVADRGPGVPPDQIENMFDPFVRGEPSRNRETGGVGLGLGIARAIARQHGGDLILYNRPGSGLIAKVTLPIAKR